MKMYVLGDQITVSLFGIMGIPGRVVNTYKELVKILEDFIKREDIGIIIVPETIVKDDTEDFLNYILRKEPPFILTVPGKDTTDTLLDKFSQKISRTLGIKV